MDNFLGRNKSWLEGNNLEIKISLHPSNDFTTSKESRAQGWPQKLFEESFIKTERPRVVSLVQSQSASELTQLLKQHIVYRVK